LKSKTAQFVEFLLKRYQLAKLPIEGGVFFQRYKSSETIPLEDLPERYRHPHPYGTGILYLLTDDQDSFSAMHVLPTDEIYHFYLGDPVEMLFLFPDSSTRVVTLGQDLQAGQEVQYVAPAGVWHGSHLAAGGEYALLGTTMAPGYIDEDFVIGNRIQLIEQYPEQKQRILRLTRE
jgi:uncharacterized protein